MDRTEGLTMTEFLTEYPVKLKAEGWPVNPNMVDDILIMDHWKVKLSCLRRSMTVHFSMGTAHQGREPTVSEVMNALALDSAGVENNPFFPDWAAEYGYDEDSRKAEKIYKACVRQAIKLRRMLGDDGYSALLNVDVE